MLYPNARILIFCKAPQAGKVKTRLAKSIGTTAAANMHEHLAWHCINNAVNFALAPVELWCAPDTSHRFFQRCHDELGIPLKQQTGDDLGQRMQHALRETLRSHPAAVLIGTDCPGLSAEYMRLALSAACSNKTVIGPAEDGGYVLLGSNSVQPMLFVDIPWGTAEVYEKTAERISGEMESLPPLWDVDHPSDLKRLREMSEEIKLNKEFLRDLNALQLS